MSDQKLAKQIEAYADLVAGRRPTVVKADSLDDMNVLMQWPKPDYNTLKRLSGWRQVSIPYPGRRSPSFVYGRPFNDMRKAVADGEREAKKYRDSNWPGGMASVVAVIELDFSKEQELGFSEEGENENEYIALVNTYYSPS